MFNVHISLTLEIKDCPASGLPAVHFREGRDLPPEPSNLIRISKGFTDRNLCEKFPELLNSSADLHISGTDTAPAPTITHHVGRTDDGRLSRWEHPILAAEDILQIAKVEIDGAEVFIRALVRAQEENAREYGPFLAAEDAERERAKRKEETDLRARTQRERQLVEIEREKKARVHEAQLAWCREHGSPRLQRVVVEELFTSSETLYWEERLVKERPGWVFYADTAEDATAENPLNPTEEAFALLDEARKTAPEAILQRWFIGAVPSAWCAYDVWFDRQIVYFGEAGEPTGGD